MPVVRCPAERARATAERLRYEMWLPRFDLPHDLPLRAALVADGTGCLHLVAVISHLATDGLGLRIVIDDFLTLLGGGLPARGMQPLELAALEARPEISRRIHGSGAARPR